MPSDYLLVDWPPALTKDQEETLTLEAITYALSNGLLYRNAKDPPPSSSPVFHTPFTLLPSPFPRKLFHLAQRLQRAYNILYARVAMDEAFLDRVMGAVEGVGKVDEFVGQLWTGWKQLRDQGYASQMQLGLFRSDYLLHNTHQEFSLKQVEFNTIAAGGGPMSERTADMHRNSSTQYYNVSSYLNADNFPPNNTIAGLAEGLAEAHKAYGVVKSCILFVTQGNEGVVFDQRLLEYELYAKHAIRVIRQTFDELGTSAKLDPTTLALQIDSVSFPPSPIEISTVYFRAGYTPNDFPTSSHYSTRFLLEKSRAIKCPSIPLQLAGMKVVQKVLTEPGVLESFLCDRNRWKHGIFEADDLKEITASWMGMWGLDDGHIDGFSSPSPPSYNAGVAKARSMATSIVLKPQREGGGNNVYRSDIPSLLDSLPPHERQAWIAMELINSPEKIGNYLVLPREGVVKAEVVNELGIYGWCLFSSQSEKLKQEEVGWLVRTKKRDFNEGGVSAGSGVYDSLLLLD